MKKPQPNYTQKNGDFGNLAGLTLLLISFENSTLHFTMCISSMYIPSPYLPPPELILLSQRTALCFDLATHHHKAPHNTTSTVTTFYPVIRHGNCYSMNILRWVTVVFLKCKTAQNPHHVHIIIILVAIILAILILTSSSSSSSPSFPPTTTPLSFLPSPFLDHIANHNCSIPNHNNNHQQQSSTTIINNNHQQQSSTTIINNDHQQQPTQHY